MQSYQREAFISREGDRKPQSNLVDKIKQSLNPCNPQNKSRSTLLSTCPTPFGIRNHVGSYLQGHYWVSLVSLSLLYCFKILQGKKTP